MTVVAFSHIAVRVSDLDRALALYRDRLGFRPQSLLVVADTPSFREAGLNDVEMTAWFGHRDGTVVELQAVTSRSGRPVPDHLNLFGFRHLAFRVENVPATGDDIVAAGGRIDWATRTRTRNDDVDGEAVFGSDPDGQRLEFLELAGGPQQPCGSPLDDRRAQHETAVTGFDHVALGVAELDRAIGFYTSAAVAGVIEHRDEASARIRVFDTVIVLERASHDTPTLGIRRLGFVGAEAADIRDVDGPHLVITAGGSESARQ